MNKTEYNFTEYRILIVDDIEMYMEIECSRLTTAGFKVDKAHNGKEAIEMYLSKEPWYYQAIIMDIMMPILDGREAAKSIRESKREDCLYIPIIAVSIDNDIESIRKSLAAGFDEFISKPIDFLKLFEKLDRVIRSWKMTFSNDRQPVSSNRYNKLWKKLIDIDMTKTELRQKINCSTATLAKLSKGDVVSLNTLKKICGILNCKLEDIIDT